MEEGLVPRAWVAWEVPAQMVWEGLEDMEAQAQALEEVVEEGLAPRAWEVPEDMAWGVPAEGAQAARRRLLKRIV